MTPEETKNEDIYTINDLTDGEIRSIEYAYGQFIHNAVSGDFAETNDIMDAFRARIKKKPQQTSIPATEEEIKEMNLLGRLVKNKGNGIISILNACNPEAVKHNFYFFNPDTKCWEDWEEK